MGAGTGYFVVMFLLSGASIYGAVKMWGLKKMGFYIYAGAQALLIIFPLFFGIEFCVFGLVMTVLFIVLYYINLKHME